MDHQDHLLAFSFEKMHTPANQDVPPKVFPFWKEGDDQQGVKIQPLHQEPEEIGHDTVLEENHHGFAAYLEEKKGRVVKCSMFPQ